MAKRTLVAARRSSSRMRLRRPSGPLPIARMIPEAFVRIGYPGLPVAITRSRCTYMYLGPHLRLQVRVAAVLCHTADRLSTTNREALPSLSTTRMYAVRQAVRVRRRGSFATRVARRHCRHRRRENLPQPVGVLLGYRILVFSPDSRTKDQQDPEPRSTVIPVKSRGRSKSRFPTPWHLHAGPSLRVRHGVTVKRSWTPGRSVSSIVRASSDRQNCFRFLP